MEYSRKEGRAMERGHPRLVIIREFMRDVSSSTFRDNIMISNFDRDSTLPS